jgi:SAM-dependent methyltransferase
MPGVVGDEAKKLARIPGRWRELLRPRRWRQFFSVLRFDRRAGNWQEVPGAGQFQRRQYASYGEYLRHQQSKLQYLDLTEYDRNYRRLLGERLKKIAALKKGVSVLCLGARLGTEVAAFEDLGCFAVGVDLNPGPGNPRVLHGDFHDLQFAAETADVIFTNSLDHAFDLEKLTSEIKRVLKPGGLLIIEAIRGAGENTSPDHYASLWWKKTEDLAAEFERRGFKLGQREAFEQPWPGESLVFSLQHPALKTAPDAR